MALESIFCDRSDQLHYSIKEEGEHSSIDGCVCVNLPKLEKAIIVRSTDAKGLNNILLLLEIAVKNAIFKCTY